MRGSGLGRGECRRRGHGVVTRARAERGKARTQTKTLTQTQTSGLGSGTKVDPRIVGVLGVCVAAFLVSKVAGRKKGSVDRLVSRGMLDEDRDREKDPYFQNMMKNINTVQVETLSRQQIEQARRRRAGDLAKKKKSTGGREGDKLEDFSIPDNHPWAEKKEVDASDEELIKARLAVKRGLPLENLDDGDQGAF
ncbi:hypothetical protein HOP50_05g35570 [Chloropicon primus]|uniref:Uncharacterized protein n=1 Tax=Chloropicon primus TaxID=1764295 RepID=A0A5B8MNY1_9CHLO|nr:hypothetical protein A3770_05p35500 [Chloropicon primus]UPR00243.1 hypothetical protein HOP50_05g35570 [Chloropicon primus]|eukprot:QDZ21032.1 hypothetical protein A3770_05p35500 [Chloropicon primus]